MAANAPAISVTSDPPVAGGPKSQFHPPPAYAAPPPPGFTGPPTAGGGPPGGGPAKSRLAQLKNFHRGKSSSTSTLYVSSTGAETLSPVSIDIFDERKHPLTNDTDPETLEKPPEQDDVYRFIDTIFEAERLSAECGIMMMAYIDRVREKTNITLDGSNWRRVVLSTLILASKVWEDQAVWNVDFLSVFPAVTVKDLGNLEKVLLRHLEYNVSLKASLYAKYYFELRSLAEQDERNFPLEPLDKDSAKRLEQRSMEEEEKVRDEDHAAPRSKSMNYMKGTKTAKVILN